jgi:hypothetical protein
MKCEYKHVKLASCNNSMVHMQVVVKGGSIGKKTHLTLSTEIKNYFLDIYTLLDWFHTIYNRQKIIS